MPRKYVILREFPAALWADTGVDFTELMKTMMTHELWKRSIVAVEGAEIEVVLSKGKLIGSGSGRAVVDVVS